MSERTVVVLGGGTGGVVAARRLRRKLGDDHTVVLVERDPIYRFAPSFLWVMTGARRPGQVSRDLRVLRRRGIDVLTAEVFDIDLAHRRVKSSDGEVAFDRLVVALGAELAPDALPGFAESAFDVYTLDGAAAAGDALRRLDGGRVVVLVSSLPYKCPAAPYEAAFLAEALLRRRGRRDHCTIEIYTPEPFPMPTAGPVLGDALVRMLAERGIGFHPDTTVERVEPGALVLTDGDKVFYDVLLGVPPHRAPEVVRTSGLAGATGFVPVDRANLSTSAEHVFAIGDVTTIPIDGGKFLPKAGVFAEREAEVVVDNIAADLAGRPATAAFDGTGACFVELGDGRAAFATGDFFAPGAPKVRLRRPGRHWHLAKIGFEQFWLRRSF